MTGPPNKVDPYRPAEPQVPGVAEAVRVQEQRNWRKALAVVLWGAAATAILTAAWTLGWLSLGEGPQEEARAETPSAVQAPEKSREVPGAPPLPSRDGAVIAASLDDLARPWDARRFLFPRPGGEVVPALVVRLPRGASSSVASYWAFALEEPFGRCELEYLPDPQQVQEKYGYRARHPVVADPCNGTVYDPLRYGRLPTGSVVRGEVVHGPGLRPPLTIELRLRGRQLQAVRLE